MGGGGANKKGGLTKSPKINKRGDYYLELESKYKALLKGFRFPKKGKNQV